MERISHGAEVGEIKAASREERLLPMHSRKKRLIEGLLDDGPRLDVGGGGA